MRVLNLFMLIAIVAMLTGGAIACSGTKATPAPAAAAPTVQRPAAPTQAPVVPPPPQPTIPPPPPAAPSATAVQPTTVPPPAPAAPTRPPVAVVQPTAQPAPAPRNLIWKEIPTDKPFNFPNAIMVRESNYHSGAEAFYRIQGSSDGLKFGKDAVAKGANRDGWYAEGAEELDALKELYKLVLGDLNGNMPGVRAWVQLDCVDTNAQVDAARQAGYELRNVGTAAVPNWFVRVYTNTPPEAFLTCKDQQGKGQPSAPANPAPQANAGMPEGCTALGVPVFPGSTVPEGEMVVARAVDWNTLTGIVIAGPAPKVLTAGGGAFGANTALDLWRCYPNEMMAKINAAGQLKNDQDHGIGGYKFTMRAGVWTDLKWPR